MRNPSLDLRKPPPRLESPTGPESSSAVPSSSGCSAKAEEYEPSPRLSHGSVIDLVAFLGASGVMVSDGPGEVVIDGCDHTRQHAIAWAEYRSIDKMVLAAFLDHYVCTCDRTILERAIDGEFVAAN